MPGNDSSTDVITGGGLAAALALAAQGFHVFPVVAGGKLPAIEAFPEKATRDEAQLTAWFRCSIFGHDHGHNVGIYTGRFGDDPAISLCVIDVDDKGDKHGSQELEKLVAGGLELPTTYTQHTASGGRHLVYRTATPVANNAGKLGPGIDVRGTGGFIVGAGSATDKGAYSADGAPVAAAPDGLLGLCAAHRPRQSVGALFSAVDDSPEAAAQAVEYLRTAPVAVQGSGGDTTTFAVCARVKDFGLSESGALAVLLAHWNDRCTPPWEESELAGKVANAFAYGKSPPGIAAPMTHVAAPGRLVLTRADSVTPEPIRWLWEGWLAAGKFHILAGQPGTGKTTLAMKLAAVVSNGGRWPDGSPSERGRVLVWSGEDSITDTLVPRLIAADADCSRVQFISARIVGGESVPFDPSRDAPLLADELTKGDVRLLIVDPIVSAVAGDSHKNAEVRRSLQALIDVGEQHGCAILGISHFSKGTQGRDTAERITGSIAFMAMARVAMVAGKHRGPDGKDSSVLARTKSNIGRTDDGFTYEFVQLPLCSHPGVVASSVVWGGPVTGAARELLATAEADQGGKEPSAVDEAADWLREYLAEGPKESKELQSDAAAYGIKGKTLRKAQERLAIKPKKIGMAEGWQWSLPEDAPAEPKMPNSQSGAPSENEGHLRREALPPTAKTATELFH
jgi:putative DNA primase/helicase